MKLKGFIVVPVALSVCFLFFMACRGVVLFGGDCPEVVDQQQLLDGTLAGFGEFDDSNGKGGVRYRGQGFTNLLEVLTAVEFNMEKAGSTDLRVFIDTAKEDSTPEHDLGGAIFSFTIPNSELKEGMKKYFLPKELNVSHGKKYVMYFAPYKNGEYCDDYRNMFWSLANPYDGGKGVVNINGEWSVSDWGSLDLQFKTYGRECSVPPPPPTPTPICTPTPDPEPQPTPTCTPNPEPQPTPVPEKLTVEYTLPWNEQADVDPYIFYRIEVGFSDEMDPSGFVNESSIVLKKSSGGEVLPIKEVKVEGKKVYFYITPGTVEYNQGYKVTLFKDRIRSAKGAKLAQDYVWTFGTRKDPNPQPTPTPTLQELKVEKTIPKDGETGVSANLERLTAFFNFNIDDEGSVGPFSAELKELESGTKISISYIWLMDAEVRFYLTSGSLKIDKIYRVTILKDKIKGKNGAKLESDYSWTFSTGTTNPTPTPPPPTPTPSPTPKPEECDKVSVFKLSIEESMKISVGEEGEIIVSVECEEGFSVVGIPILAKIKEGGQNEIISLNGKLKREVVEHVVLTDHNGEARFTVKGLKRGKGRVRFKLTDSYGYFKGAVLIKVR